MILSKHHAMKTYGGGGDIALHFLHLDRRWSSPQHPSCGRLGGIHNRTARDGENNVCPCRESKSGRPARSKSQRWLTENSENVFRRCFW
jgi:hypothetical protein